MADGRGRPVALPLTPGSVAVAPRPLGALAPPRRVPGDRAYDADSPRRWLAARGTEAVVPSTASRRTPYPLDRAAHARRNLVERLVGRPKNRRCVATRYDRLARNRPAAIALIAVVTEWAI